MELEKSAAKRKQGGKDAKPSWPTSEQAEESIKKHLATNYCVGAEKRRKIGEGNYTKGGAKRHVHKSHPYCSILELIAAALHGGNTQATLTVCFREANGTLYITSQARVLEGDFLPQVRTALDSIIAGNYDVFCKGGAEGTPAAAKSKDITQPPGATTNVRREANRKSTDAFVQGPLKRIWDNAQNRKATAQTLREKITQVITVNNRDIGLSSETKTHVHGESRVLRYFFLESFGKLDTTGLQENVGHFRRAWKAFRNDIRSMSIYMGSSQGACLDCAGLMNLLGIYHSGLRQVHGHAASDGWKDPLSLYNWGNRKEANATLPNYADNVLLLALLGEEAEEEEQKAKKAKADT